jgi:hypothetical protein
MWTPCLEAGSDLECITDTAAVDSSPVEEMFNQQPDLAQSEIDDLLRLGVPALAVWTPTPLRAATALWVAPGRFEFQQDGWANEEGERAILVLVDDGGGRPLDIIAWAPPTNRIGSWLGYTWGLGEGEINRPRLESDAMPVWRSPLGWLKAHRRGVVLLKPQLAAMSLRAADPLQAEDVEHGCALEKQLTIAAPRIVVPASSRGGA